MGIYYCVSTHESGIPVVAHYRGIPVSTWGYLSLCASKEQVNYLITDVIDEVLHRKEITELKPLLPFVPDVSEHESAFLYGSPAYRVAEKVIALYKRKELLTAPGAFQMGGILMPIFERDGPGILCWFDPADGFQGRLAGRKKDAVGYVSALRANLSDQEYGRLMRVVEDAPGDGWGNFRSSSFGGPQAELLHHSLLSATEA